jgi:cytochrome c oxidase cbb3-type subunit 3
VAEQPEKDSITGIETTGHEWDGIKELNNPLPRWWLWVLYASIIWSIGYWILMPAWPMLRSHTTGFLGYAQRATVAAELAEAKAAQSEFRDRLAGASLEEIRQDAQLLEFALAGGRAAFGDNCAPCHGTGAQGFAGYPNLNDDDWIWGGSLEDIQTTLAYGIRSGHEETRESQMPAFLRDQLLSAGEVSDVTEYVLSLSGRSEDNAAAGRGETLFADNCAGCHGEDGGGSTEFGAPNLADAIWLYGGDRSTVAKTVANSRQSVMPAWTGRLDEVTIKQLAIYVHALGGGQ